jgi:TetR/AcrR family transcriptional regulator
MRRHLQHTGSEGGASGRQAARDAILNAAQEIFARDGFSGARVDDIAQTAGYNKALIFHYFDDKLGLYRALMFRTKERLFARFDETFNRLFAGDDERVTAASVRALAAEILDTLFDFGAEHPPALRILAWEAAEGWQTFVGCAPSTPDTWPKRVRALLERAQAAGVVRADLDPRLLFTTLTSLPLIHLISLPRFAAMFPDTDFTSPAAIAHAREQITELVLRGILTSTIERSDTLEAPHEASDTGQASLAHPTEEA